MINVVTILFENLTILLCLHIVFGERINKVWLEVIFPLVSVPLFALCSFGVFNKSVHVVFVVFVFWWCSYNFTYVTTKTMARMLIGFILVGVIEVSSMYIMYPIVNKIEDVEIKCNVISLAMLILSWIIFVLFMRKKFKISDMYIGSNVTFLAILLYVLWLLVKIEFEHNKRADMLYVFFFFSLAFSIYIMLKKQKLAHDLEKKTIMLEMNDVYGNAYKELLQNVRRRQHDYKNQLLAVSGSNYTLDLKSDIDEMKRKYVSILEEESVFDNILTKCDNPILAGYMYNICSTFLEEGVTIVNDIKFNSADVDTRTKDIIEIVGILLNNAKDNILSSSYGNTIFVEIKGDARTCRIAVKNPSEYISFNNIESMFRFGYSSKGEDRGIGLYALKNIVDKYKGSVEVYNETKDNVNFISFVIII